MTLQEALDRADMLRPNNQDKDLKIRWLSELDGLICREILSIHVQDEYTINIEDGGTASQEDWARMVDMSAPPFNAGKDPRFVINGNDTTYIIPRNGRTISVPAPVYEAVINSAEIFKTGGKEIAGRTYTPVDQDAFMGYDHDTDPSTELVAEFPYDDIYTFYLCSKIDLQNLEIDKYNNDKELFNNAYTLFSDYWTRTHRPIVFNSELHI